MWEWRNKCTKERLFLRLPLLPELVSFLLKLIFLGPLKAIATEQCRMADWKCPLPLIMAGTPDQITLGSGGSWASQTCRLLSGDVCGKLVAQVCKLAAPLSSDVLPCWVAKRHPVQPSVHTNPQGVMKRFLARRRHTHRRDCVAYK